MYFSQYRLLGQTTKQPLSNFESQRPWKYKQFWGVRPDLSCYRKSVVSYHFNFYVVHDFFSQATPSWNWQKVKQMLSYIPRLNFCYYLHSSFTLSSKNNRTYSKKKEKENVCLYSWDCIFNYSENVDENGKLIINSPRSRNIVNIKIVSVWWCLYVCIKQHLSCIWSSIHEKVKQHWCWVEKKRCL